MRTTLGRRSFAFAAPTIWNNSLHFFHTILLFTPHSSPHHTLFHNPFSLHSTLHFSPYSTKKTQNSTASTHMSPTLSDPGGSGMVGEMSITSDAFMTRSMKQYVVVL